jgi:ABC-type multidrug transport system fused ATPase/permease subunit
MFFCILECLVDKPLYKEYKKVDPNQFNVKKRPKKIKYYSMAYLIKETVESSRYLEMFAKLFFMSVLRHILKTTSSILIFTAFLCFLAVTVDVFFVFIVLLMMGGLIFLFVFEHKTGRDLVNRYSRECNNEFKNGLLKVLMDIKSNIDPVIFKDDDNNFFITFFSRYEEIEKNVVPVILNNITSLGSYLVALMVANYANLNEILNIIVNNLLNKVYNSMMLFSEKFKNLQSISFMNLNYQDKRNFFTILTQVVFYGQKNMDIYSKYMEIDSPVLILEIEQITKILNLCLLVNIFVVEIAFSNIKQSSEKGINSIFENMLLEISNIKNLNLFSHFYKYLRFQAKKNRKKESQKTILLLIGYIITFFITLYFLNKVYSKMENPIVIFPAVIGGLFDSTEGKIDVRAFINEKIGINDDAGIIKQKLQDFFREFVQVNHTSRKMSDTIDKFEELINNQYFKIQASFKILILFKYFYVFITFILYGGLGLLNEVYKNHSNINKNISLINAILFFNTLYTSKDENYSQINFAPEGMRIQGNIKINNNTILENLNLGIDRKTLVILMGGSGEGKSTLMNTIMKLIDIEGNILIYDEQGNYLDYNNITYKDLVKQIYYAKQTNNNTLNLTIYDRFKQHGIYKESLILYYLNAVGAGHLIPMLNHNLGKLSSTISGGEESRLKLAIYLAVVKQNGSCMGIFDETLGNLDEINFYKCLKLILELDQMVLISIHKKNVALDIYEILKKTKSKKKVVFWWIQDGKVIIKSLESALLELRSELEDE